MHSHLAPNPDENFFLMYYIGHYVYLNKDLTGLFYIVQLVS